MSVPEVGSSRKMTLGNLSNCKAIVNFFFCPPLSPAPTVPPTTVSASLSRPIYRVITVVGKYHSNHAFILA